MILIDMDPSFPRDQSNNTFRKATVPNEDVSHKSDHVVSELGLGDNFAPGPFDVICARGKNAYNHSGNKHFRELVAAATDKYARVKTKLERTIIVSEIVDVIQEKGNGFVKRNDRGMWEQCDEILAREKTGQLFRNSLGNRYKSSVLSKRKRRETVNPQVVDSLQDILFSNDAVKNVMATVAADIDSGMLSDDEVFAKLCQANSQLLSTFNEDSNLVARFTTAEKAMGRSNARRNA